MIYDTDIEGILEQDQLSQEEIKHGEEDQCWNDFRRQNEVGVSADEVFWLVERLNEIEARDIASRTEDEIAVYEGEGLSQTDLNIFNYRDSKFIMGLNGKVLLRKDHFTSLDKKRNPKHYDPTSRPKFVRSDKDAHKALMDIARGRTTIQNYTLVRGMVEYRSAMIEAEKRFNGRGQEGTVEWVQGYIFNKQPKVVEASPRSDHERNTPVRAVHSSRNDAGQSYNGVFGQSCRI